MICMLYISPGFGLPEESIGCRRYSVRDRLNPQSQSATNGRSPIWAAACRNKVGRPLISSLLIHHSANRDRRAPAFEL
ncbi:hypothetical protein CBM2609_B30247 [Cupriavidus taiwanensis]|nr:hypothetical protein CBM2604_B40245 [Cupriavidus taiwanensis]SOZ32566.1 hypothetical protein CBM2609_B30247 [Cupriavidus taiwanensis]SOZ48163.1 hypothetical protein CBM2610_B30245 [Cupriavidus taiwanensis]